jgi:CheY-like chemotaxis protein
MGPSAPITVLVVDDEPDALLVLRRLLEHLGYSTIGVQSAKEALNYILKDAPPVGESQASWI